MLQLTLAYIQQADREREVAADLRDRLILKSADQTLSPIEPAALATRTPRRAPVRARAAGR